MKPENTFKHRVQPYLDAIPEGADKETLLALVNHQDTLERPDSHPRERAKTLSQLRRGLSSRSPEKTFPGPSP